MSLLGVVRQAWDAWEVPRDLVLGRYPEFVRGGALPRGQVPVFVFHSLEAATFRRKLEYLSANVYATCPRRLIQFLMALGPVRPRPRAPFDDEGRAWERRRAPLRRFWMTGIVPIRAHRRARPAATVVTTRRRDGPRPPAGLWSALLDRSVAARAGPSVPEPTYTHARPTSARGVRVRTPESRPGTRRWTSRDPRPLREPRAKRSRRALPSSPSTPLGEGRRFTRPRDPTAAGARAEGGGTRLSALETGPEILRGRAAASYPSVRPPPEKEAAIRRELCRVRRVTTRTESLSPPLPSGHVAGPTARLVMRGRLPTGSWERYGGSDHQAACYPYCLRPLGERLRRCARRGGGRAGDLLRGSGGDAWSARVSAAYSRPLRMRRGRGVSRRVQTPRR